MATIKVRPTYSHTVGARVWFSSIARKHKSLRCFQSRSAPSKHGGVLPPAAAGGVARGGQGAHPPPPLPPPVPLQENLISFMQDLDPHTGLSRKKLSLMLNEARAKPPQKHAVTRALTSLLEEGVIRPISSKHTGTYVLTKEAKEILRKGGSPVKPKKSKVVRFVGVGRWWGGAEGRVVRAHHRPPPHHRWWGGVVGW